MNKKVIDDLAKESFVNGNLDEEWVKLISARLKKPELREYIEEIKSIDSKNVVEITLPQMPNERLKKQFDELFKGREIVYNIDASLFPGIRIAMGDLLYEVSLKNSLEQLLTYLKEQYD